MSFVAVIDADRHKFIWSRAIASLASISDNVKFVVGPESLTVSAVNAARTSHGEIVFNRSFFHEYTCDFDDIICEGFERIPSYAPDTDTYSFVVNSKHLAILFKNFDVSDLEYVCFKIHWGKGSQIPLRYKFLIEIKTKKLILKKYQTNYQPVLRDRLTIATEYHQQLSGDAINYIKVEQMIPKQFLDMIPQSTEDFKLEVKHDKLSMSAYTKQIMKDREYLKQPMSVTVSLNLDELLNTNLIGKMPQCINFRLKDFKNFINLITSFSDGNKSNDALSTTDDYFEVLFGPPGAPILFELDNNEHLKVQFIQITSDDGANLKNSTIHHLQSPHILQRSNHVTSKRTDGSMLLDVARSTISRAPMGGEQDIELDSGLFVPELSQEYDTNTHAKRRKTDVLQPEVMEQDTEYENTDGEEQEKEISQSTRQQSQFGPTQGVNVPKSIFD
ncbi:DNA damage checkpoint protein 1 [[Candida] anglica]|uniref:DNA damage checkpoint protein 1 n=1 Tax=[Candida] anglica TaxID=148631 RepID=A0ABP0EG06_9ASCO